MSKTFTLEEANRALVFVAPVVKEIQKLWEELMTFKANPNSAVETTIRQKLDRLKYCSNELAQVGCIAKDPTQGIIDFPSEYQNQPILLCWHAGEEQLEFWHSTEEGFENRRAIDESFTRAFC